MAMAVALATWLLSCASTAHGASVSYTLDIRSWVVDFKRPSIQPRIAPFDIPADAKLGASLANNSFPGPTVEAYEGDTIEVTVINHLEDHELSIDWEGVEVKASPAAGVRQQGGVFKYVLQASKAGTAWWHASSEALAATGLKGPLIVRSRNDPLAGKYQEEIVLSLSDARQRPLVCLDGKGSLLGGCAEVEKATLNGQWGDGSKNFPKPVVEVKKDKCYLLRVLGLMSQQDPYFTVSVQDHSVEIDGANVGSFKVRHGESIHAILCANKGSLFSADFSMTITYIGQKESTMVPATLRYVKGDSAVDAPLSSSGLSSASDAPLRVRSLPPVERYGSVGRDKFDRSQCEKDVVFELRDWIVDYKRPTKDLGGKAGRQAVETIPVSNRKNALLVNNSYPGPLLEAVEGQLVCVTVVNNMETEPAAIHWHGQHMKGFPAFDGVYGVHQGAIGPGKSFTYRWRANTGTHFYHGHMQALQADKGMKGPIVIHAKNDPHKHLYDDEQIVAISDEWVDPGVCLRNEGAQPGNPVCMEIEKATWNGQWGDGSDEYPWPMITVEQGKCYRLRFIGMMGQAQNFQITMAGHNMTVIAVDGADVEPTTVSMFNLHAGERYDVVVCANQEPGNYLISAVYDLATFLETAPAPRLPRVDSSKYWSFLNYKGHNDKPGRASKKILGGYNPPAGTGGGAHPKAVAGFPWDTNLQSAWRQVRPLNPEPQPEKADVTYVFDVGVAHPSFKPGESPYATTDNLYMFTEIKPWKKPETPLLHTKGQCGAESTPFITVPENATTVEVIINNLSPTAHVLHMHGMRFSVINYAPFSEGWCSAAQFECFFLPISVAKVLDCKNARLGDSNKDGPGGEYWGCPFDAEKDTKSQNLEAPLQKDMISLWRRSWAVIRFKVDNPGVWLFHCHMEQHIPTGQMMAFNLLPSKQPPIPDDVPTEGSCPVWSGRSAQERPRKSPDFFV
eukprot:TRINITY_DN72545_c0_g1_i1.p1 TRINITY_DN72545_c0_g1~~TRINITY_DN72545_c0_g1_i1.p1  ORF type:complete len:981 (+),score=182.08 TRINITY_DN72545_c0_g1_i1:68-2944(+)